MIDRSKYIPFPKLPIHSKTKNLSQEDADRIFDVLCKKYSGRTLEILDRGDIKDKGKSIHPVHVEETYERIASFICFGETWFENSPSQEVLNAFKPVPQNDLGILDLTFELRRRWVAARGYEPPEIHGKTLAPSPKGPFPKNLPANPISKETKKLGFTQEEVDCYVDQYYQNNKKWCYILGEIQRRNMCLYPRTTEVAKSIFPFPKTFSENESQRTSVNKQLSLRNETWARIWLLCELPTLKST